MDLLRKLGIRVHSGRRLEKKHRRRIERSQFNFACAPSLIVATRVLAEQLEVPVYLLMEHLIQTGAKALAPCLHDPSRKEDLQRHLLRDHLRVTQLDPRKEPDYSALAEEGMDMLEAVIKSASIVSRKSSPTTSTDTDGFTTLLPGR